MRSDELEMRSMALDDYAAWMIANGRYDVDEQGAPFNVRTGKRLKPTLTRYGYFVIGLSYSRAVLRQVKLHRFIAIKRYGVDAVRDKQVAHLDGSRTNNTPDNLRPLTPKEHVYLDGTHRNLEDRSHAIKKSWPRCVRCGAEDGPVSKTKRTPDRISGLRFGITGEICRRCYGTLQERERRAKHKNDD